MASINVTIDNFWLKVVLNLVDPMSTLYICLFAIIVDIKYGSKDTRLDFQRVKHGEILFCFFIFKLKKTYQLADLKVLYFRI